MSEAIQPQEPSVSPLRGDLTQGPILSTLVMFSLPMLATNLLQSLNSSINTIWVGHLIGEGAVAATAIGGMVMFLLYAVIFGLGNAATIRVGHFYGAQELVPARRTFAAGIGFCAALALIAGIIGHFAADHVLRVLATPAESFRDALIYLRISFVTMPFGTVSIIMAMALRGAGDSRTPLFAMGLTVVLDAVLNPVLILGLGPAPALGIAGSALATAFANLSGTLLMIAIVQGRGLPLRLRGAEWRFLIPDRATVSYTLAKGLPMGAQMLALSAAGLVMIGLVNRQGLNAAAAYGASLQIWNYLMMPSFAVGMAVSAMVAQSIGADRHDRVGEANRIGLYAVMAMTLLPSVLIILAARPLLALFLGGDSPALDVGEHIIAIATWSFVFSGIVVVLNGTMRAYGEVVLPLIVMVVAMYPGRIGFYFATRPWLGEDAVWWAFPAGTLLSVALTWLAYAKGRWRDKRISVPAPASAG
ncbi:MAG: MATE family efflux transporter [Novosphingobium sp.]|nr:MATE family efflux transporter [Novosphingobium sp.]